MSRRWLQFAASVLLVGGDIAMPVRADEVLTMPLRPEICDLAVKADPAIGNVTITWSGGAPPFVVVRGDSAKFSEATQVEYISMDTTDRYFVDSEVLRKGSRFYYQVYDYNSVPEVFSMTPAQPYEGDVVTIRGIGFSLECAENIVLAGGLQIQSTGECGFTGFQFIVPRPAVSGPMLFVSHNGAGGFGDHQSYECDGMPRHPPTTW